MSRLMYSGISGMKVNQTKLDVVGNNIANSSTTAFKYSNTKFADMLSQNSSSATAPSTKTGGTNASQVGLGVQLASIDTIMTQGNLQSTSRALDVAIDQSGFFIVSQGPAVTGDNTIQVSQAAGAHSIDSTSLASSGSKLMYTRDGSFTLDRDGNLLTSSGYRVMGYSLTNDSNSEVATSQKPDDVTLTSIGLSFSFGPGTQLNGYTIELGNIGPDTPASASVDTDNKKIIINADFTNSNLQTAQVQSAIDKALTAKGISQQVVASGEIKTDFKIPLSVDLLPEKVSGDNVTASLSDLSLTLPKEMVGYSVKIGTVTEGTKESASVDTDAKTITLNGDFANGAADITKLAAALKNAVGLKGFVNTNVAITGTVPKIKDTASHKVDGGTSVQSLGRDGSVYFVDGTGKVSAYDESLKSLKIPDKVKMAGTGDELRVTSYTISEEGVVYGNLENGKMAALGQIAMANFKNPEGLEKSGGNLYTTSANSGDAIIKSGLNTTGDDNSKAYGDTIQGMLEMSNVDLAEQFTDMIIATRAFQASSKAINTGDEILQDIINLKR
ncbi:flagellar hook protein FlgE [Clostridium sp. HCP1S3_B4]|uniref:flagellar hook protein FlgE n=1 Tax=unclassified Clostridium TaxID=2614128 RepID=UPI003F8BF30B